MPRPLALDKRRRRASYLNTFFVLTGLLAAASVAASLLQPAALAATTFTVNSTGDGADGNLSDGVCNDGAGNCTLRAAIQQANTSGTDAINFSVAGTINLTGALPEISANMVITGPGSSLLTVRRNTGGNYRILNVAPSVVVGVSGLTLTNGRTADGAGGNFGIWGGSGGGVANFGTLTLTDVRVTANATGNGGNGVVTGGSGGPGGGVYNGGTGTLTMTDCVVSGNSTGTGGSGPNSNGWGGDGGGVYNAGALTMTNTVVSGNACGAAGAGIAGGSGGGVYHHEGTLTLNGVTVGDNRAGDGNASGGVGGSGGGGFFRAGVVTLTNSTVGRNAAGATPSGGGGDGGGILTQANLTVTGSTISDNTTPFNGGGIMGKGAGVLKLVNSTFSGNTARVGGGMWIDTSSPATLTNCTVTDNTASLITPGVSSSSQTTVGNTIIAGNDGTGQDAGGLFVSQGHNIVGSESGSPTGCCFYFTQPTDKKGTLEAPFDPKLGPLADNGGPTRTHAPLADSPALDAGDNSLARDAQGAALTTDQRGAGRFAGPGVLPTVDVGAFELNKFMNDLPDMATNEDTPLSFAFFVGDQTVTSLTITSANQTLVPNANISFTGTGTVRTVRIAPAAELSGASNITVNLNGSHEGPVSQTFQLTVRPVNDAPAFTKGTDPTVAEDSGPQSLANWATGISAGPGEAGQTLAFSVAHNTNPALFSAAPSVSTAGTLAFTPAPNASGSATVFLELMDNGGSANGGQFSTVKPFTITVTPVNDPPVAHGDGLTINEDSQTFIRFSGNDPELDNMTFSIVSGPAHGTLTGTGTTLTYKPDANYNGPDSVVYKAVDTFGAESAPATISLTIKSINDAPVITVPGSQITNQSTPITFSAANSNGVSVADVDAGTDPILVSLNAFDGKLTLGTSAGLTFVTGDGTDDASMSFNAPLALANAALNGLVYKPNAGFNGVTSFLVGVNDQGPAGAGGPRTDLESVFVTVRPGGAFRLNGSVVQVAESAGTVTRSVLREGGSDGAASVNFSTADGTATGGADCGQPGVDYVNASGTLSWADGDVFPKPLSVTVCNDSLSEANETLTLTLSGAGGSGNLGFPVKATMTIFDDDAAGGVIELSQSGYAVAEGAALAVTVKRSGDTTRAASVGYATDDGSTGDFALPCFVTSGVALDRCDFTKAQGTLNFAPGETEKTFSVLVGDDSYVEDLETALVRLSNPTGGATLGLRSVATLEIIDDAQETTVNPIDVSRTFVRQHYHDFLGREPDASGLDFWTNEIESCGADAGCREVKRINVSAAFFLSIEFQETGFLAYRLHKVAFGNIEGKPVPLTLSEFLSDTQGIGRGVVVGAEGWQQQLEDNKRAFADAFAARARFLSSYPAGMPPETYVDQLNANAGGVLSQEERDSLVADLRGGAKTRAAALRAVAEHPALVRRESNQAFVLMQFFGYLRRDPNSAPDTDFGGYNFWLGKLNEFDGNFIQAEMVKAFLSSDEYRKRFGQ